DVSLLSEHPSLVVVDVSFISVHKMMPKIAELLSAGEQAVVLVKPQFEGSPREAPGGVIRHEDVRLDILRRVREDILKAGWRIRKSVDSSIRGRKGNLETFLLLGR